MLRAVAGERSYSELGGNVFLFYDWRQEVVAVLVLAALVELSKEVKAVKVVNFVKIIQLVKKYFLLLRRALIFIWSLRRSCNQ